MSSDEEKIFSLDELPDEGSVPVPKPPSKRLRKNPELDPRLKTLSEAAVPQKVEVMLQRWYFDERIRNYNWVFYVAVLLILEFTPIYQQYMAELDLMNRSFFEVGGDIIRDFTVYIEGIIRNPAVLILLTPLFFNFSKPSDYAFEISFDGINTVKKYIPIGSKEMTVRVLVKWKEIDKIRKGKIDGKDILHLHSLEGHIADIIWYIENDKKRAIKHLLQGMVISKHPLRVFLENEKDLK